MKNQNPIFYLEKKKEFSASVVGQGRGHSDTHERLTPSQTIVYSDRQWLLSEVENYMMHVI